MNFTPEAILLEVHLAGNMPASRHEEKENEKFALLRIITGAFSGGIPDVSPDVSRPFSQLGQVWFRLLSMCSTSDGSLLRLNMLCPRCVCNHVSYIPKDLMC